MGIMLERLHLKRYLRLSIVVNSRETLRLELTTVFSPLLRESDVPSKTHAELAELVMHHQGEAWRCITKQRGASADSRGLLLDVMLGDVFDLLQLRNGMPPADAAFVDTRGHYLGAADTPLLCCLSTISPGGVAEFEVIPSRTAAASRTAYARFQEARTSSSIGYLWRPWR